MSAQVSYYRVCVTLLCWKLHSPYKKGGSKARGRLAGGGSNAVTPAETVPEVGWDQNAAQSSLKLPFFTAEAFDT